MRIARPGTGPEGGLASARVAVQHARPGGAPAVTARTARRDAVLTGVPARSARRDVATDRRLADAPGIDAFAGSSTALTPGSRHPASGESSAFDPRSADALILA